jgi:glycyl-radical enzyme activating protein
VSSAQVTGWITEIQRFSIHDGPGIRTTVFFKGCPLRCCWCHNPETQGGRPQLSFTASKCIACGDCVKVCPQHEGDETESPDLTINRAVCTVCGACARACPTSAREIVGREVGVDEVIREVDRDRPFYRQSCGGMTLSGGEPLLQADFAVALLQAAKAIGLHTCIETCAQVQPEVLGRVLPLVDLFLCDYKETDSERHRAWTGLGNDRILANLRWLHGAGASMLLRCPIIPGLNDRDEHFDGIVALARELRGIEGIELMPYHRLGEGKIDSFGLSDLPKDFAKAPEPAVLRGWVDRLVGQGVRVLNQLV